MTQNPIKKEEGLSVNAVIPTQAPIPAAPSMATTTETATFDPSYFRSVHVAFDPSRLARLAEPEAGPVDLGASITSIQAKTEDISITPNSPVRGNIEAEPLKKGQLPTLAFFEERLSRLEEDLSKSREHLDTLIAPVANRKELEKTLARVYHLRREAKAARKKLKAKRKMLESAVQRQRELIPRSQTLEQTRPQTRAQKLKVKQEVAPSAESLGAQVPAAALQSLQAGETERSVFIKTEPCESFQAVGGELSEAFQDLEAGEIIETEPADFTRIAKTEPSEVTRFTKREPTNISRFAETEPGAWYPVVKIEPGRLSIGVERRPGRYMY